MLRKLIVLAITSGVAKKVYDNYRRRHNPFPTAQAHPRASRSRLRNG